MDDYCRIELLGGLCVRKGNGEIPRFRTKKAELLLAYLACFSQRSHSRDMLIGLLWPESDLQAGRSNLRSELSGLRDQFESLGIPPKEALIADRSTVRLNPSLLVTDVGEFEAALRAAAQSNDVSQRIAKLLRAVDLYHDKLLPGHYNDWIIREQERLAEVYRGALRQLAQCFQEASNQGRALHYAQRAVQEDPLCEESHRLLIRLHAAAGQPEIALRHYEELKLTLQEKLETSPDDETVNLAAEIRQQLDTKTASQQSRRPRLPYKRTRFFGREEEIEALIALLKPAPQPIPSSPRSPTLETRLVTLTGPGGSGKTRLAVEVAGKMTDEFHEAVWFVSLADITDARLVADAILEVLEVQRSATLTPLEQVIVFLNRQPSLLILDNCEHLLAEAARVVLALQTRVSGLSCLVTSRRRLALEGEHEFAVDPLPAPKTTDAKDQFMQFASVQLFVDRAVTAFLNFQLNASNMLAVAQLCARLEGIPLAIELAAARVGEFTPTQMLERISARFEFLATASADHPERHRSLWAAIDWSFDLLSPALKRLFVRLSVFHGGCTADAVKTICERPKAHQYLAQLRGYSLVTAEEACGEMRTLMLETLREYANELLEEAERSALARRHADYFLKFIEAAEPNLIGSNQIEWLARIESELDNLRAALDWCGTLDDTEIPLRFTGTMGTFWHVRGHFVEGKERLTLALTRGQATGNAVVRAKVLNALGEMAWNLGEYSLARLYLEESLEFYRAVENRKGIAKALHNLGHVAADQSDFRAAYPLYEESLAIRQELGDRQEIAWALHRMGAITRLTQSEGRAYDYYMKGLELFKELNDDRGIAWTLIDLGSLALIQGDYVQARTVLEEGVTLFRRIGEMRGVAASLSRLGEVASREGNVSLTHKFHEESLAFSQVVGHKQLIVTSIMSLGKLMFRQRNYRSACSYYTEAMSIIRETGSRWGADMYLGTVAILVAGIGKPEQAAWLFGASEALHEEMNQPLAPSARAGYIAACADLDQEIVTAAWAQGRKLTNEQAIAYALIELEAISKIPQLSPMS